MSDRTLSHGLWDETSASPPSLESLTGNKTADVVVIGGGYTGLSAVLHLAEKGIDTILLEAFSIGSGGAGRNVGFVNAGLWLMPDEVIRRTGEKHGEQLLEVLGASPDLVFDLIKTYDIRCEAVRNGTLHCAHSPEGLKELEQREAQWKRRGAPVTLLGRKEAAPRIGSDRFYGALFDERAGTIQPLSYAYGLANAADAAGACLHIQSPVTGIKQENGFWRVETPAGNVIAKKIIQATLGYPAFAFKHQVKEIIPFNYFQFATTPLPREILKTILPGGEGALDTNMILSSFRTDQAGRLLVGSVGQVENLGYSLHESWARRTIQKIFPQVGPVMFEHAWNGRIAMTPDHIPRFHIPAENMVSVSSYNGRGIGPGTVFGKLLAQLIMGASPQPFQGPTN